MAKLKLPRRTFLKGLGGLLLPLPPLEIMFNSHGQSYAATGGAIPKRYALLFCGQSLAADGYTGPSLYQPDNFGRNYDLKLATQPLGTYGITGDVSIVSNLKVPYGGATGWTGNYHPEGMKPQLMGRPAKGVSSDQIVADQIGANSFKKCLVYRAQVDAYEALNWVNSYMSWRVENGFEKPVSPQTSPQAAWNALFSNFTNDGSTDASKVQAELDRRASVLDFVSQPINKLMSELGKSDQEILTDHLDAIRDLERRIASTAPETTNTCQKLADPGPDPAINQNAEYSDEATRARLFCDLIHMAFTCDLSRVATLMLTTGQCSMNVKNIIGVDCRQHDLGHSSTGSSDAAVYWTEQVNRMIAWHIDFFAYLVKKLKETPEGSGNLLDNTVVGFMNEGGFSPPAEGDGGHTTNNMINMLAGRVGGLQPGQHIDGKNRHPASTWVSAMKALGIHSTVGNVTTEIPELFQK